MREVLYPDECPQVNRHSSIDQFGDYVKAWKQGGYCPVVFDQLDYIGECSGIHSHPVAITFGESEYVYPEGKCVYISDRYVYTDKRGVEHLPLPECFGGKGEFYDAYVDKNAFTNFDSGGSLGVHNEVVLRTGLDYVKASESLPPAD